MKVLAKCSYVLLAMMLSLISYASFAGLTVTATGTNGTCLANASITANASGNSGTVYYELIDVSTSLVLRNYQGSNIFSNLPAGSYMVQVLDASTNTTAQSGQVTLTTTYVDMNVTVTSSAVSCATATTATITVSAKGGNVPYSYAITAGPVTAGLQASNTFNNLPVGSYTISVTDACAVTVIASASIAAGTATTTGNIVPRGGAFVTFGKSNNKCTDGAFVNINNGWGYLGSGTVNLSAFDQNHFSWRYIYPSGSGNIYGAGGVLNAAPVSCSNNYLEMPATATYPYGSGDLILYDECGNSTVLTGAIKSMSDINTSAYGYPARGDYDCVKGGSMEVSVNPYNLLCLPVYWTFTDQTTNTVIRDTSFINNSGNYMRFYGFTPGDTYTIAAVDAFGNNASKNTSANIPSSSPYGVTTVGVYPDYNLIKAGFLKVQFPYTLPDGTTYSYTVTASSNATGYPAVGYTKSYTVSSTGGTLFSDPATPFIYGPNSDGSWPSGTYTIAVTAGCISNPVTFTVTGINASLAPETITPVCGGFDLIANASMDNPSLYGVQILAGSASNIGAIRTFGSSTTAGTYSSAPFSGLSYGFYKIALITTSTSSSTGGNPLVTHQFTYAISNTLSIDALSTGGYICAGNSTGDLTVTASSSSGNALQYSMDGGINWQSSNIFTGVGPGTYPVVVKDGCSNITTYNASVVQAPGISITASPNPACAGANVQLNANTIGATSYAWTGPNGFTSSIQNPTISNIQTGNTGTYIVTITTPTCVDTASLNITVNTLPTVSVITGTASMCAGSTTQLSDITPGGAWSSSSTAVATVDATGKVSGVSAGTAIIAYTVTNGSGCTATVTQPVTVNAVLPMSAITGTASVCAGSTTQLSDATPGGVWSSSNNSIATIDTTGKVSGVSAGTAIISYTITNSSGCTTTITQGITVNAIPSVSAITGYSASGVCTGSVIQLNDVTSGGVWSSSTTAVATVDTTGKVSGISAGTAIISYAITNSSGCVTTVTQGITVNAVPLVSAITGYLAPGICLGSTIQLSDITPGGVWSSSTASVATVDTTGKVSGVSAGTAIISYAITNSSGCTTTVTQSVTVNAFPAATTITGTASVCAGSTTKLSDAIPGGVWSSSNNSIATIDTTGKVSGISAGTAIISYAITNSSGCVTTVTQGITVNAEPSVSAITGYSASGVCTGSVMQLNDAISGGVWSSGTTAVATVDTTGKVSGVSAGTAIISYAITNGSGCTTTVTQPVTVNYCRVLALAKNLDSIKLQGDGTYNAAFTFVVQNQGQAILTNVSISDNLVNTFTAAMNIKVVSLSSTSATLLVNNNFTGTGADTSLLLPGSVLVAQQTESIHLVVNINPQNLSGTFYNTAYGSALSNGVTVPAVSVNGLNVAGNPSTTPVILPLTRVHIPGGFSPNNDGVNDRFVIGNYINYNIIVEMYNRWGNKVYDSKGYYQNDWDGTCNQPGPLFNIQLPDGTYYYIIKVFEKQTNALVEKPVGFITIKR